MSALLLPPGYSTGYQPNVSATLGLVDIGANMTHTSFAPDLARVLERAKTAGVTKMMITGASKEGSVAAMQLAQAHSDWLFATAGVHPHHADEYDAFVDDLLADLLKLDVVKAAGECGLDYNRNFSPRDQQLFAFECQLKLAVAANKPVFLHQRDAHADFLSVLKEFRPQLKGAVVHCFTDTRAALDDYLALDCHIGITGWICDERRGVELFETVKAIPDDRLMIETDAPYLMPRNIKPLPKDRRNLPEFLPWVLDAVARSRGATLEHIAEITRRNAEQFFAI
jgi:TatD DNase family protein